MTQEPRYCCAAATDAARYDEGGYGRPLPLPEHSEGCPRRASAPFCCGAAQRAPIDADLPIGRHDPECPRLLAELRKAMNEGFKAETGFGPGDKVSIRPGDDAAREEAIWEDTLGALAAWATDRLGHADEGGTLLPKEARLALGVRELTRATTRERMEAVLGSLGQDLEEWRHDASRRQAAGELMSATETHLLEAIRRFISAAEIREARRGRPAIVQ